MASPALKIYQVEAVARCDVPTVQARTPPPARHTAPFGPWSPPLTPRAANARAAAAGAPARRSGQAKWGRCAPHQTLAISRPPACGWPVVGQQTQQRRCSSGGGAGAAGNHPAGGTSRDPPLAEVTSAGGAEASGTPAAPFPAASSAASAAASSRRWPAIAAATAAPCPAAPPILLPDRPDELLKKNGLPAFILQGFGLAAVSRAVGFTERSLASQSDQKHRPLPISVVFAHCSVYKKCPSLLYSISI